MAVIQPVTYQTTRLLACGVQPSVIAKLDGVKPNTVHVRRLRFERATGGTTTGRFGKRGRRKKDCIGQKHFWPDPFH